ncbi:MAG: tetratricopeptide repeat protein [Bacteroidota bacterium]
MYRYLVFLFLPSLLLNCQSEPTSVEKALSTIKDYEQTKNEVATNSAYQAFLLAYPEHEQAKAIQSKLTANLPPLSKRLTNLYYNTSDTLQRISIKGINDYILSSKAVAFIHPQMDSIALHLKRSAESAISIKDFETSLSLYDLLIKEYPNTKESEQALFRTAFIYDNDLKKLEEAKAAYEDFLEKYPNSEFAQSAEFLLKNIGKDDAEILESLLNQQQQ